MPIIYPAAVIEKILEKIVEKVTYIAVNLTSNMEALAYKCLIRVVKPTASLITSMATSIMVFVFAFRLYIEKITYKIISNPKRPSPSTKFSFDIRELDINCLSARKLALSYIPFIQSSPPTVMFKNVFSIPIIGVEILSTKKPTLSFTPFVIATKPSPTVTTFSTSVEVRKTP
jgi:hypothetical protein